MRLRIWIHIINGLGIIALIILGALHLLHHKLLMVHIENQRENSVLIVQLDLPVAVHFDQE